MEQDEVLGGGQDVALDGVRGVEWDEVLDDGFAEQNGYTYHVYYIDDS